MNTPPVATSHIFVTFSPSAIADALMASVKKRNNEDSLSKKAERWGDLNRMW